MNRIYGYLRASTKEQDASRAKKALDDFCEKQGLKVSAYFLENESGATLERPELFKLLEFADSGDVLLVEQVDRISRLENQEWEELKKVINSKGIKIVSLDLPTSHSFLKVGDKFTERMLSAINNMMLDMLAAIARKDYDDRRKRQKQGIERAKKAKLYKGRQVNESLHRNIERLLRSKASYNEIIETLGCSRATIAKVSKKINS